MTKTVDLGCKATNQTNLPATLLVLMPLSSDIIQGNRIVRGACRHMYLEVIIRYYCIYLL